MSPAYAGGGGSPSTSGTTGAGARNISANSPGTSRPRWRAVRTTLDSTCWVSAPRRVRLPPHTLRMTTAGRIACSARQLVASIDGSRRKRNTAGNSLAKCLAKRLASSNGGGASISRPSRASSRPRSTSRPRRVSSPFWQVPHVQAGLEDRLDLRAPGTVGVVFLQCLGAAEQVIDATLVQRVLVAPVHLPPVAHEHAGVVGPQHGGGIVEPAAGTDRIDRRVRRGVRPQPMTPAADAPAGLVRGDDRRVADLLAEFLVGRRGVAGGAVEQAGETARGDVEVERVAQQVGDLRQRDAHLGVHFDHEADDSGAELYAGRTQRVGGLQGVSALHPPPALRAVPDLDIETPHKGAHLRQFFLILRRHPGHVNRAAAVRTRRRHRRREGLVDLSRARAAALPTVACASPPSGMPAATLRPVLGKGGCLSAAGPPRLVELLLEAFAATLPSVPVAGGARQFTTQPADLAVLLLDALVPRITLAPGRLRTAQSAALASHTARIGAHQTCTPLRGFSRFYPVNKAFAAA